MAKRDRRARRPPGVAPGERYITIGHFVLGCPAWAALSGAAVKLLLALLKRYNGVNNGEISFSVREAQSIGLGKSAAADAFNELVQLGFLVVAKDAAFSVKTRLARTWCITMLPVGEAKPTREFMHITAAPLTGKNRRRSAIPDTLSGRADTERAGERNLPATVRLSGPSSAKTPAPQSGRADTYSIPGRGRRIGRVAVGE